MRVDLIPKPPYPHPVLVVDVFGGSAVGMLLGLGAAEVWVAKSVRAARILAEGGEGGGLLFGEQEGLPPEGFHYGTALQPLVRLSLGGRRCVLLNPQLAEALEQTPPGTALAQFRNARTAVSYALEQKIAALVAAPQSRLEPSLANTVATGFLAKRLHQAMGGWGELQEGARLATVLLKSFPDPQEALVQSEAGKLLYRTGRTEDLALASLVSADETVPKLAEVRVLDAQAHGLTKDRFGFCFRG